MWGSACNDGVCACAVQLAHLDAAMLLVMVNVWVVIETQPTLLAMEIPLIK